MNLTLDKKWFNPLYFILNDLNKDTNIRFVLVYGGKSSSKTVSICQLLAKESVVHSRSTIGFRKESTSIPTTLKKSFNLAIDSMYLYPAFDRQDRRYVCKFGSEIVLKGIDNEEKAKGIESYTYLYLDELNHFEEEEFDQFNMSLRGIPNQKIYASWNPIDENSWVKTKLVDKYQFMDHPTHKLPSDNSFVRISTCGKVALIKTIYDDNYWIAGRPGGEHDDTVAGTKNIYGYRDENLISEYKSYEFSNYSLYQVNVLGEWGKTTYGGEFWRNFKTMQHVKPNELRAGALAMFRPDLPIHMGWDKNVHPYQPCALWQMETIGGKHKVWQFDEIAFPDPRNTVGEVIRHFVLRYPVGMVNGLFIYGDKTANSEDSSREKGDPNFYSRIMADLAAYHPRLRLQNANPSVAVSKDFINEIYAINYGGITIEVGNNCKLSVHDYQYTLEDINGGVNKSPKKNPKTGVTYQEFGHFSDIKRYVLTMMFAQQYAEFISRRTGGKTKQTKNVSKFGY